MKRNNFIALKIMSVFTAATVLLSGCSEKERMNDGTVISSGDTAGNLQTENSDYTSQKTSLPTESSSKSEVNSSTTATSTVQLTATSSSTAVSETNSSTTVSSTTTSEPTLTVPSSTKPSSSTTISTTSSKPSSSATTSTTSSNLPSSTKSSTSSSKPLLSTTTSTSSSKSSSSTTTSTSSSKSTSSTTSSISSSVSSTSSASKSSSSSSVTKPEITPGLDENEIYKVLISFKVKYPDGTPWTNETRRYSSYTIFPQYSYYTGLGCAAFALELSDAAFGDLPAKEHYDISKIRVGDILRINNNSHSVIVLEVNSDGVVIAEGNINSQVLWGRKLSTADLKQNLTYIWTRYP